MKCDEDSFLFLGLSKIYTFQNQQNLPSEVIIWKGIYFKPFFNGQSTARKLTLSHLNLNLFTNCCVHFFTVKGAKI